METEIQVYNVDTMGPVVSLYAVKWMLQDVVDSGVGGARLRCAIMSVDRILSEASLERPVRLAPSVPGGAVAPMIARLPHTFA